MLMSKWSRLGTVGLAGGALAAGLYLQVTQVDAARPSAARQAVQEPQRATAGVPVVAPPAPAFLDRYCVTCHNEKLKTAGFMLDTVDVGQVGGHAELLEKVVRKLRR